MSLKKKTGKAKPNQKIDADLQSIFMEALSLHKKGNVEDAATVYREILGVNPNHYDAIQLLGTASIQKEEYVQAISFLKKAIDLKPQIASPYLNLGIAYRKIGNLNMALEYQNEAIAKKPDYAEAYFNRGNVFKDLNSLTQALKDYETAIAINPNFSNAINNREIVLRELKQIDQSSKDIATILDSTQHTPELHYDLGLIQLGNNDYCGAIKSFEKAINLNPSYYQAYNEVGLAYFSMLNYNEALVHFNKALAITPNYPAALNNRGLCYQELRNLEAAISDFQAAIIEDVSNPNLHWNLALALLTAGDLERGFDQYEWRFKTEQAKKNIRPQTATSWQGKESLSSKTILVFTEQGFGDSIQFSRFINYLDSSDIKVIFEVENALFKIMNCLSSKNISIIKRGDSIPSHDYECSLLSLPRALSIKNHDALYRGKYLHTDRQKVEAWSRALGVRTKLRVGLVWSGGIRPEDKENLIVNDRRNIPLSDILALENIQNIELHSLQKGELAESELTEALASKRCGKNIRNHANNLLDFSDTAALIENLDLIISVDTAVAHLAGSLGKPIWMLNRYNTDWRWGQASESSLWYPSMKIFRQRTPGNWASVIDDVINSLNHCHKI